MCTVVLRPRNLLGNEMYAIVVCRLYEYGYNLQVVGTALVNRSCDSARYET
jgi:hypothetical protein